MQVLRLEHVQEIKKESQEYTKCTLTSKTQSILSKQVILSGSRFKDIKLEIHCVMKNTQS
jgi:hypothetical protein